MYKNLYLAMQLSPCTPGHYISNLVTELRIDEMQLVWKFVLSDLLSSIACKSLGLFLHLSKLRDMALSAPKPRQAMSDRTI